MGGLCSGKPNIKNNKEVKKEREKQIEHRRKVTEESKNNNNQVSSIRRISNPRINSLSIEKNTLISK